ncbi:MAG: MFS transporter [Flavisolibacter sp.]
MRAMAIPMNQAKVFSPYQKIAIALLAVTQFTVILDFMVMSPMGDMLMKAMNITTVKFGLAVSAYAFSAGLSGLMTAGFADRFDRKKLLLFFYAGFLLGTLGCGLANSYQLLLFARIVTGLFGGVIGSISMAIMADLFSIDQRGRAMGFIQMGFGASQVLGIPISLFLANQWGWHAPFLLIVCMAFVVMVIVITYLRPITGHLALQIRENAWMHLWHTFSKNNYRIGFTATALLSIGGFMMMPFGSAFAINNLKVSPTQLPFLFMMAGVGSLIFMPLLGKLSDQVDKFKLFAAASIYMMVMILVYTNLTPIAFWIVVSLNILMMAGILGRMVPSTALVTSVPDPQDRGAFMSINSSLQQIAGGFAAAVAGMIVVQDTRFSPLKHYNILGIIIVFISIISVLLMYRVGQLVKNKNKGQEKQIRKMEILEKEA